MATPEAQARWNQLDQLAKNYQLAIANAPNEDAIRTIKTAYARSVLDFYSNLPDSSSESDDIV